MASDIPNANERSVKEEDVVSTASQIFSYNIPAGSSWEVVDVFGQQPSTFSVKQRSGKWTVMIASLDENNSEKLEVTLNEDTIHTIMSVGTVGGAKYRFLYTLPTETAKEGNLERIIGGDNSLVHATMMNVAPEIQGGGVSIENRMFITALYGVAKTARLMSQKKG